MRVVVAISLVNICLSLICLSVAAVRELFVLRFVLYVLNISVSAKNKKGVCDSFKKSRQLARNYLTRNNL